jgi:cupin 2 domain-containing protein
MTPDEPAPAGSGGKGNLFADLPATLTAERFDELLRGAGFRLERILSKGQRSPAGFWYDQPQAEWVLLLRGGAGLRLEGEPQVLELAPGDYLIIPAHCRHRVEWTATGEETVWLAIHYNAAP